MSEIQQYLQYQAIQLITQRSFLFQQQKKAREYELLTYMLNSKFGQRKEHFFLFNGFGLKVPKPYPTSPFPSQKVKSRL